MRKIIYIRIYYWWLKSKLNNNFYTLLVLSKYAQYSISRIIRVVLLSYDNSYSSKEYNNWGTIISISPNWKMDNTYSKKARVKFLSFHNALVEWVGRRFHSKTGMLSMQRILLYNIYLTLVHQYSHNLYCTAQSLYDITNNSVSFG